MLDRMNVSEVGKAMLVTGLVLLASAAALLFSAEAKLRQSNRDMERTTSALLKIEEINSLVIGVDYSARGYALTGQVLFLDHEYQKQGRLKVVLDELMPLVGPQQQAGLAALKEKLKAHAAVYEKLVALGPKHAAEVAAVIIDPVERQKRYEVLNGLEAMRSAELKALKAHQAETEQQQRRTSILTFIIVAIAFLGGMTDVMARLWRDRRRRSNALATAARMLSK
ncbi:CHASE3 domain sensor protein [Rhizomicrobium palustre]|uniref:CHASE3 domain sensor protein n=1 Tax=Rhizomicrobium palustre TaxID=189966 RepID=A0A846N303_9PROT|nr:CHASE3 domain-containing protein [Rhizomicrobium palustre]NIK90116.1 CHASE3 domain sensor protein [Rhizomicrobium palustre]